MRTRFGLAVLVAALGEAPNPAQVLAATLRVPSQYGTINAALDAAVAGDEVLVAPAFTAPT
jgi:hypothetical protein